MIDIEKINYIADHYGFISQREKEDYHKWREGVTA